MDGRCWSALAPELLTKVFALLEDGDRYRASQVCKPWNQACRIPELWRERTIVVTDILNDTYAKVNQAIARQHKLTKFLAQFGGDIRYLKLRADDPRGINSFGIFRILGNSSTVTGLTRLDIDELIGKCLLFFESDPYELGKCRYLEKVLCDQKGLVHVSIRTNFIQSAKSLFAILSKNEMPIEQLEWTTNDIYGEMKYARSYFNEVYDSLTSLKRLRMLHVH